MCYTDLCKVLLKQFQARNRQQAWARTHGGTDRLQTPRPIGAVEGRGDKMTDKILKLHQCSLQQTKMPPRHSAMLLESGEGKQQGRSYESTLTAVWLLHVISRQGRLVVLIVDE